MKKAVSKQRKSIDEFESEKEHEGEEKTLSALMKHRLESNNIVSSKDELKE